MDSLVDIVRQETLLAMYESVERMNLAIYSGDRDTYNCERDLQEQLRREFENLLED